MRLATAQIDANTKHCFGTVQPPVQAVTPPGTYWVIVDLDDIGDPTGKLHDINTGKFQ